MREKIEQTRIRDSYTPVEAGFMVRDGEFKFAFIKDGKRYAFRVKEDDLETIHVYARHLIPLVEFEVNTKDDRFVTAA